MKPIIFTHCGKLGDMLYCLPIAHAYWLNTGRKVHWVLPHCFPPFRYVRALLELQEATDGVTFVDHKCGFSGHGGQPYSVKQKDGFDPFKTQIFEHRGTSLGELQSVGWSLRPERFEGFLNLGFRDYPDQFVTAYQAKEHQLPWDPEFTLYLGEREKPIVPDGRFLRGEQRELAIAAPHTEQWPMDSDLLTLIRSFRAAQEVHTFFSGGAAMCFLARIPFTLHYVDGHPPRSLYLPADQFGGPLITPVRFDMARLKQ